jgi:protein TonB
MNPESILQSKMLDIIFENRNKEYGAYELRICYEKRLRKALKIVLSIVTIVCGIIYADSHFFKHKLTKIMAEEMTEINFAKTTDQKTTEWIKPKAALSQKKIATTTDYVPKIVRNGPTNPTPTVETIDLKQIGKEISPGEVNGNIAVAAKGNDSVTRPETKTENTEAAIPETADVMPEFPGGEKALKKFLSNNMKMPKNYLDPGTKINVLEKFVVDENGNISGFNTIQSGGTQFDNEVIRVLKKMPRWKPGRQKGQNIAVYFKLPVIFISADEN